MIEALIKMLMMASRLSIRTIPTKCTCIYIFAIVLMVLLFIKLLSRNFYQLFNSFQR